MLVKGHVRIDTARDEIRDAEKEAIRTRVFRNNIKKKILPEMAIGEQGKPEKYNFQILQHHF